MIIAMATVSGFQNGIREKVTGANGHIVIDDITNVEGSVPVPLSGALEPYNKAIKTVPGVRAVFTCIQKPFIAKGDSEIEGMVARGVDPGYDFHFISQQLVDGVVPDFNKDSNQILISTRTAARLGLKTGDRLRGLFFMGDSTGNQRVRAINPIICGLFNSGFDEFDRNIAITSRAVLRRLLPAGATYTHWQVELDDYSSVDRAVYAITQVLPEGKFNVSSAERYNRQIFDWLKLLDTNVIIILFLMLLVASINMSTALLILITERTQMIGILKAMGATSAKVIRIFLYQGIIIIALGMLAGDFIAFVFSWLQDKYQLLKLDQTTYYVDHVLVDMAWWHIPAINAGTILVCTIILLLPSALVSRLSPIRSIRFQ